jgi:hypothetical protein
MSADLRFESKRMTSSETPRQQLNKFAHRQRATYAQRMAC